MKRTLLLVACLVTLAACGGDSALPNPTGKGDVRMINAIPGSPEINFLIEERLLASVGYKESSPPADYDDFDYIFNFEVVLPGDTTFSRVASSALKVERDRDHIFMLSGDLGAPTVTRWDGDIRTFDGTETVFEFRFAHGSNVLDDIDIYFDPAGTVLGTNPPVATLSFGEISTPADFEAGPYVLTITDANDIATVHFTSTENDLLAQFAHVATVLDGDGNDTAPVTVRSMTSVGNPLSIVDATFPPQIRLIHSAYDLPALDVYDDDQLTSLVTSNLAFANATTYLDTTSSTRTFYFTEAGSTAQILFENVIAASPAGTYAGVYVVGDLTEAFAFRLATDRATISGVSKINVFHGAADIGLFDAYLVQRGEPLDEDAGLVVIAAVYGTLSPEVLIAPGNYDLYVTERGNQTAVSAPFALDITGGEIIDLIVVNTVDPAVVDVVDVSAP